MLDHIHSPDGLDSGVLSPNSSMMIRKFGEILYNTNNRTRTVAENSEQKGKKKHAFEFLKNVKKERKAESGKSL